MQLFADLMMIMILIVHLFTAAVALKAC